MNLSINHFCFDNKITAFQVIVMQTILLTTWTIYFVTQIFEILVIKRVFKSSYSTRMNLIAILLVMTILTPLLTSDITLRLLPYIMNMKVVSKILMHQLTTYSWVLISTLEYIYLILCCQILIRRIFACNENAIIPVLSYKKQYWSHLLMLLLIYMINTPRINEFVIKLCSNASIFPLLKSVSKDYVNLQDIYFMFISTPMLLLWLIIVISSTFIASKLKRTSDSMIMIDRTCYIPGFVVFFMHCPSIATKTFILYIFQSNKGYYSILLFPGVHYLLLLSQFIISFFYLMFIKKSNVYRECDSNKIAVECQYENFLTNNNDNTSSISLYDQQMSTLSFNNFTKDESMQPFQYYVEQPNADEIIMISENPPMVNSKNFLSNFNQPMFHNGFQTMDPFVMLSMQDMMIKSDVRPPVVIEDYYSKTNEELTPEKSFYFEQDTNGELHQSFHEIIENQSTYKGDQYVSLKNHDQNLYKENIDSFHDVFIPNNQLKGDNNLINNSVEIQTSPQNKSVEASESHVYVDKIKQEQNLFEPTLLKQNDHESQNSPIGKIRLISNTSISKGNKKIKRESANSCDLKYCKVNFDVATSSENQSHYASQDYQVNDIESNEDNSLKQIKNLSKKKKSSKKKKKTTNKEYPPEPKILKEQDECIVELKTDTIPQLRTTTPKEKKIEPTEQHISPSIVSDSMIKITNFLDDFNIDALKKQTLPNINSHLKEVIKDIPSKNISDNPQKPVLRSSRVHKTSEIDNEEMASAPFSDVINMADSPIDNDKVKNPQKPPKTVIKRRLNSFKSEDLPHILNKIQLRNTNLFHALLNKQSEKPHSSQMNTSQFTEENSIKDPKQIMKLNLLNTDTTPNDNWESTDSLLSLQKSQESVTESSENASLFVFACNEPYSP